MSQEMQPHRTPADAATLIEALGRAYIRLFLQYPSREFCLVILGQTYSECGDGAHNCWLYDIGNVQARVGGQYDWCTLHGAWEIVNGQRVNQAEHFRAFASLDEGCDQHLAFLHERFPTAFQAAMTGDPAAFAHELRAHGYYTAPEADYARNVHFFMQKYAVTPLVAWEQEMAAQQPASQEGTS